MRVEWQRSFMTLAGVFIASVVIATAQGQGGQGGAGRQGGQGGAPAAPAPPPMKLMVEGISEGAMIPMKYTCAAQPAANTSPAMSWSNAPTATMSFAVLIHDVDPRPGKGFADVLHWLTWNLPVTTRGLAEGVPANADMPDGSHQIVAAGRNGGPAIGYRGPCPPPGAPAHHYMFEVFALDSRLDLPATATRADVEKAMDGHIIGHAVVGSLFARPAAPPQ
jgi:Raf kinase inhibitor-like YbhB/YbcL family protein